MKKIEVSPELLRESHEFIVDGAKLVSYKTERGQGMTKVTIVTENDNLSLSVPIVGYWGVIKNPLNKRPYGLSFKPMGKNTLVNIKIFFPKKIMV